MSCNFIEIHSIYTLYIFFITNKLWLLGPNAGLTLWRKHHIQITHRGRSAEILHLAENGEWAQLAQFLPNIMRSDTVFFCIFLHLRVSSQLGEGCSVMTPAPAASLYKLVVQIKMLPNTITKSLQLCVQPYATILQHLSSANKIKIK